MSPLITYLGKLLIKNNALATDISCCCEDCVCTNKSMVTINFGKDAGGGLAYPYGSTNIPFISQTLNDNLCTIVWGSGGLTLTIVINNIGVISTITLVDNRVGGHNKTWSYVFNANADHRPCLQCYDGILTGVFDRWTINGFSNRPFGQWHEGQYTRYTNDFNVPVPNVAPTLANGGIVNLGNFLACISYRFKVSGYHQFVTNPTIRYSDAEYQQATFGEAEPWTSNLNTGAPFFVTKVPTAGGLGAAGRVVTDWGASNSNHIYRGEAPILAANSPIYAFINDSLYSDNAPADPYYVSGWQQFPNITM